MSVAREPGSARRRRERATAALDASARTADRRDGPRTGFASQLWCEARRVVLSPTGTEDCELRDAASACV